MARLATDAEVLAVRRAQVLGMELTIDDMTAVGLQLWIVRERERRQRLQAGEVIDWREERLC